MKLFLITLLSISTFVSYSQDAMYEICPIKNAQKVPSAMVYNLAGEKKDLQKHIGNKPTIVVFYRGGWCPYCMRHLSALGEIKDSIDAMGFELIGITPDDYSKLDTSITRSGAMDYTLFSDKDAAAMEAFGVGWKVNAELYLKYKTQYNMDLEWWSGNTNHILPVPAVFIIKDGVIQYQHVDPNYKKRLSPEILMAFLKALV
ncbi:MAG: redoxin domain-containing protein [Crocinitomix sp.]|nr:redoxin domain-containing protein [Crocinitomix sp.]